MASQKFPRLQYLRQRMLTQHAANPKDLSTDLRRCLNTFQLTVLGLGSTIGIGIYVMLGVMAKDEAGPSVIFSFAIAILVTLANAMVFAEFSTFVPQTGAVYIFMYKVYGEFAAFLAGSILTFSCMLGTSVGAQAWSGMLDSYVNNTIQAHTTELLGSNPLGPPFSDRIDVLACLFQVSVTLVVSCNVFCTSVVNTILAVITSAVPVFVFFVGVYFGESKNFLNEDHGGIFPFGMVGVVRAASLAMFATRGFEVISMSAEEAQNPAKSIPRAIIATLLIVGIMYIGTAIGMLYLIPYWLIDLRAPLPSAFEYSGLLWGKFIVTVAPMFGVTNLQMVVLYTLSRYIYRMAKDGLFFSVFLEVDERSGVPRNAAILSGVITSCFALLLDLTYIVRMNVLLMLLCFSFVGPALIRLRVTEGAKATKLRASGSSDSLESDEENPTETHHSNLKENLKQEFLSLQGGKLKGSSENEKLLNSTSEKSARDKLAADGGDVENGSGSDTDNSPDVSSHNNGKSRPPRKNSENGEAIHEERDTTVLQNSSPAVTGGDNYIDLSLGARPNPPQTNGKTVHFASPVSTFDNSSGKPQNTTLLTLPYKPTGASPHDLGDTESSVVEVPRTLEDVPVGARVAAWLSPFVPGVIPSNLLITLHMVACVTLAAQVTYSLGDLVSLQPVAVVGFLSLIAVIVTCGVILWALCAGGGEDVMGFKTPLMPVIPTLSNFLCATMFFSAAERDGFIEIIAIVVIATFVYVLMVMVRYQKNAKRDKQQREERKSLIDADADDERDDDDEDDDDI